MIIKYDVDRYNSLISRTALNCEFWRGTIQDLGDSKVTIVNPFGSTFRRFGFGQMIRSAGSSDLRSSGAVGAVVDYQQSYTIELLLQTAAPSPLLWYQVNDGGCIVTVTAGEISVRSYAGGSAVRSVTTSGIAATSGRPLHAIVSFTPAGPSGLAWRNGIPVTVVPAGAAATAACGASVLYMLDANRSSLIGMSMLRFYQRTLTNEDAACLYAASQNLAS